MNNTMNDKSYDEFINYIYEKFCQCPSQCLDLTDNFFKAKKILPKPNCIQIIAEDSTDYLAEITNHLKDFQKKYNLLSKRGVKYYINVDSTDKVKLSWENIKALPHQKQKMFWLLRKLVVDAYIKHIIKSSDEKEVEQLKIYSVGSAKAKSDYDITLYGSANAKIYLMNEFRKLFMTEFGEDSSIVFDTNIYGKAYIEYDSPSEENTPYLKEHTCGEDVFYYLNTHPDPNSQLMWGLIKYLTDLREAFGEDIYNMIKKFMHEKTKENDNSSLVNYAHKTLIYLKNKDPSKVNYVSLLKQEHQFLKSYERLKDRTKIDNKLIGLHDYISVVNFYGVETYYTRGAFLDVVINTQMCKNKTEKIPLEDVDLITSILENAGFFFLHSNKTKYVGRVFASLSKLIQVQDYKKIKKTSAYKDLKKILNTFKQKNKEDEYDDDKYCKEENVIQNNKVNLLGCEKFRLFSILMNIIYELLKCYKNKSAYTRNNVPVFYNMYVKKSSEIFGQASAEISPQKEEAPRLLPSPSLYSLNQI